MRLVVALVADFESHIARQFALDNDIPLMHQRIAEIRLHAAQRNASIAG